MWNVDAFCSLPALCAVLAEEQINEENKLWQQNILHPAA